MFIYSSLSKQINQIQPKTITVDIFDTLLMRRNRAEQWHFWQFSKQAALILKKNKVNCSPLLYFSLRNYYNRVLRSANLEKGNDYEASINSVNYTIITDVSNRNKKKVSKRDIADLCKKLAQGEIEFEYEHLFLNKKLFKTLVNTKAKIYFVTDMYFESNQIQQLLKKFGIPFQGISSADYLQGKSSGRSFIHLIEKFPQIKIHTNLHIGDHRQADIAIPERMGIHVFWLNLPAHRLKLLITKYIFGLYVKSISFLHMRREYKKLVHNMNLPKSSPELIGSIFAPAIIYYSHFLGSISNAKKSKVLFVSSESYALSNIYAQLGFHNYALLPHFSRTKLIQSYCYLQYTKGVSYEFLLPMIKKVQRRKTNYDALITLGALSEHDNSYHLAGKRAFSEYLAKNNTLLTKNLKKTYQQTLKDFKQATKSKDVNFVTLADVGWNSTIQILLSEILKLNSYTGQLSGLYIGQTGSNIFNSAIPTLSKGLLFNSLKGTDKYLYQPEVWESFLNTDNASHPVREQILSGISDSIPHFLSSDLSAHDYYRYSRSQLINTLASPKRWTIQIFAKLEFDYGTGNELPVPMVNTSHSSLYAYRLLLRDRAGFKRFYHDQGWKWGAARWYHFRLLYRLWRHKTKKPSF